MTKKKKPLTVEEIICTLQTYWSKQGCAILQPWDYHVGAGTFHPATFLHALGPDPWKAAYVQPTRRPADSRFGLHPNRLQKYYQFQVVLKPSPDNFQQLYLDSLNELGIDFSEHDVRFVEDDWKSPSLGAWGLGWEVWCDGMEVTQFTYFQEVGGVQCKPVMGEITYGIERLAMHVQGCSDVYELVWNHHEEDNKPSLKYGDLHKEAELMHSYYNLHLKGENKILFERLDRSLGACRKLFEMTKDGINNEEIPQRTYQFIVAYEMLLDASHAFNLLDARQFFTAESRAIHMASINKLTCAIAKETDKSLRSESKPE